MLFYKTVLSTGDSKLFKTIKPSIIIFSQLNFPLNIIRDVISENFFQGIGPEL